jgi:hypothetical protein
MKEQNEQEAEIPNISILKALLDVAILCNQGYESKYEGTDCQTDAS